MISNLQHIIISRTDSIGDVVLTLPIAYFLKKKFPNVKISFLGKSYTRPVIEACKHIDDFILIDDFLAKENLIPEPTQAAIIHVFPISSIAKRAKALNIKWRIGTTNRLFHWTLCNKLIRLSRKNSELHEAQLNFKLLQPFGIEENISLETLGKHVGLTKLQTLTEDLVSLIDPTKYSVILHPKSQGSAREWGLKNFIQLIQILDKEKFQIFISGTANERALLDELFNAVGDQVKDITGLMDLRTFIAFINSCDALVANSTGPLHIAAALGKKAIGIYPPIRPMHPGRWAPIGGNATFFVVKKDCEDCRKQPQSCSCIQAISAMEIVQELNKDRQLMNQHSS